MPATASPEIGTPAARAASAKLARGCHDLWLASWHLPAAARRRIWIGGACFQEVSPLLAPACAGSAGACPETGDCEGERGHLAEQAMERLSAAETSPTGRPELDAWPLAARSAALPETWIRDWLAGAEAWLNTPRFATRRRWLEAAEAPAGSLLRIGLALAGAPPLEDFPGPRRAQALAWAKALWIAGALEQWPRALESGRVPAPLELLLPLGLSDRQLLSRPLTARESAALRQAIAAPLQLMIRTGRRAAEALPTRPLRLFAGTLTALRRRRLARWVAGGATRPTPLLDRAGALLEARRWAAAPRDRHRPQA